MQAYYPQQDGLIWTYDNGVTQILSGPRELLGQNVMTLTNYFNGAPISEDFLMFVPDGVLSFGTVAGGETILYTPPLTVYSGQNLLPGQFWESSTSFGNLALTLRAEVLGVRGVQTAVGRFNALQIRQITVTSSGARTQLDLFFVPTIGVVRSITEDGTVVDLIEKNF